MGFSSDPGQLQLKGTPILTADGSPASQNFKTKLVHKNDFELELKEV